MYGLPDTYNLACHTPKMIVVFCNQRLTLYGHIAHMDDNADAKRILLASLPGD